MNHPSSRQRASVLIVAMIFAAIVAISLTTYLKLATTALNLSQRSFMSTEAMNVTEAGLEQGLWAFNQTTGGNPNAWTGWTLEDHDAMRTFTNFAFSQNATGNVKVYVHHYDSNGSPAPLVVARGSITPALGGRSAIVKMVEVYLIRRSLFANGMVGRNGLTFNGNNASVDSWNSDPDNNPATPVIPYSSTNSTIRHDLGTIAAVNITAGISVNNADIWGYASVGGNSTSAIQVGAQGVVGPFGTASGTKDPSHIAANFTDNLPDATNPPIPAGYIAPTIASISGAFTLPRGGDIAASDGTYYYNVGSISESGNASNVFTISANRKVVVIVTAGSGSSAISITGNGGMNITAGGSLAIYTAGNISIAGNGVMNGGTTAATVQQPVNFQIWGTNTSPGVQTVEIAGNGVLSGIVYAPEAAVKINGNGDVMGAIVGYTDTVVGNAAFHYDESLANWGGTNPFQISKWRELVSASDRHAFAGDFNFEESDP